MSLLMRKPHRLLTQLIIIIVAIYIPVILLSIFSLSYSNNHLKEQITSSIKVQQDNSCESLDDKIKDTYIKSSLLLTHMDLIKLNTQILDDYEYISSINRLRDELTLLNDNND